MFNIVLYEPEIPPNTGNIIRICANTGCQLHLIEPLGFVLDDKRLRRAGLDYAEWQNVKVHRNWDVFLEDQAPATLYALSTKGKQHYTNVAFQPGDYLVFGPETRGLPAWLRESLPESNVVRIPMLKNSRSMNLSNATSVIVFEAWRQQNFGGAI